MPASTRIVKRILADVTDRRGWRQEWDQFDEDIKAQIIKTWRRIVREELGRGT